MEKNVFNIENFNLIEDDENYYFIRALNMGDNQDLEDGIIVDKDGNAKKIRTDRDRYIENHENSKYSENDKLSLEQVYDHIKMNHRTDTNCISLSSNANVSVSYGRGYYKDKYVMVKVPKKEFGEKVINAGEYMLNEIQKKVDEYVANLEKSVSDAEMENNEKSAKTIDKKVQKIKKIFEKIDNAKSSDDLKEIIKKQYTSKSPIEPSKAKMQQGIIYKNPGCRISDYDALTKEQSLAKNKIVAKLTYLERKVGMKAILPNSSNNNSLIDTVGRAFSSLEFLHYGEIDKNEIINIQKEIVDIFALVQQMPETKENAKNLQGLKRELVKFVQENGKIKIQKNSSLNKDYKENEKFSDDEIYEITGGKAKLVLHDIYYLSKAQLKAREYAKILDKITNKNPQYAEIIKQIKENGFTPEPEITTKQSGKGVKLSESTSIYVSNEKLIEKVKKLPATNQQKILEGTDIENIKKIIENKLLKGKTNEKIKKEKESELNNNERRGKKVESMIKVINDVTPQEIDNAEQFVEHIENKEQSVEL